MGDSEHRYIYKKNDRPDSAYILKSGSIICNLNETDSFTQEGEDIIFGAIELFLEQLKGSCLRLFDVKAAHDSDYHKVRLSEFRDWLTNYDDGLHLTRDLAKTLMELDKIFINKEMELGERVEILKEYCRLYSNVIDIIGRYYKKGNYPLLEYLYTSSKASFVYMRGKLYTPINKNKIGLHDKEHDLGKSTDTFYPGEFLWKQDDPSEELYILNKGKLKVFIDKHPIAVVEKPGSILGEVSLLLNQPRNADVEVIEETNLSIIKKAKFKSVLKKVPNLLNIIGSSISRQIQFITVGINDLNTIIDQIDETGEADQVLYGEFNRYRKEVKALQDKMIQINEKLNEKWLKDLITTMSDKMNRIESSIPK